MNYETTKDTPSENTAIVELRTSSFRRSINGAWLPGGSSSKRWELPLAVLNSPNGCDWLNPGRSGFVSIKFPDGSGLWIDGGNDPVRSSSDSPLGYVPGAFGQPPVLVKAIHPLLPNIFLGYYRLLYVSNPDEFKPLE